MQKIHCIGIGGIGISALARYFLSEGYAVSGSDNEASALTDELEADGIRITIGHKAGNVPTDAMLVIYSPAISKDNIERVTAEEYGLPIQSYPQALGELTKQYTTIAISGSHGKSTTTSLVSLLLTAAKIDPTVIVGTKLKEFKGKNFRAGKSEYLVIEADEWNRSFHNYTPHIIVLTNIDKEHLDTYKTYAGVLLGFHTYVSALFPEGTLIANWGDSGVRKLGTWFEKKGGRIVWYNQGKFPLHNLQIPGVHNQINAEAAWQTFLHIATERRMSEESAQKIAHKVFSTFEGAWRRMEQLRAPRSLPLVSKYHAMFYSDYGHHPTEVRATLEALKAAYPKRRLVCIFEPHQRDRLHRLFKEFTRAFDAADVVILMPAYIVKGREYVPKKNEKDSFALAQALRTRKALSFYAENIASALKVAERFAEDGMVIVCMGAGSIDAHVRAYLKERKS